MRLPSLFRSNGSLKDWIKVRLLTSLVIWSAASARISGPCLLREHNEVDVWSERRSGWPKRLDDARTQGDIDYGRIVHSAAFRRLQGKTQIFNIGDSDFYRTRLTHSIEVAQVAVSLVGQLCRDHSTSPGAEHLPEASLIQAVALTHDLGHPPFGHGGEIALNYCMRSHGGFEGNGQTLRVLSKLEKFSERDGANLSRRALLGILKYPAVYEKVKANCIQPSLMTGTTTVKLLDRQSAKPPKCYMNTETDVVDWLLTPLGVDDRETFISVEPRSGEHGKANYKSFDCSIMDLADDITFGVHDLEDVLALDLVKQSEFEELVEEADCVKFTSEYRDFSYKSFVSKLFSDGRERKRAISRLVGYFVRNCFIHASESLVNPLIRYNAAMHDEARRFLDKLTHLVRERVIFSAEVQQLEFKGQQMVVAVFEALKSDPLKLLPDSPRKAYIEAEELIRMRHLCDYVSGMTDTFLLRTYERLFSPRMGSVFDKL